MPSGRGQGSSQTGRRPHRSVTTARPARHLLAAADVGRGGHRSAGCWFGAALISRFAGCSARSANISRATMPGSIIPTRSWAASEIRDLCDAFERAVDRIEGAEREALEALDGQRRLVREVHHRVKNNLQVVASLLSIHGRSAGKAGGQGRLFGDRPAGRCAVGGPPPPLCRAGGEPGHRASPAADRACRGPPRPARRPKRGACASNSISIRRRRPRTSRSRPHSSSPRSSSSPCFGIPATRSKSRCGATTS